MHLRWIGAALLSLASVLIVPRPEHVLTIEIPPAKRDLFGDTPEKSLQAETVCVTGRIQADGPDGTVDRKHRARVVIQNEEQLTVR